MNPYNIAIATGRLTKSPEIRYTDSGKAVATVTLAVNDGKDSAGKERTQFLTCVAWGKTAELIEKYFSKGDGITVVGRNTVRTYEDKDGNRRWVHEIVADGVGFPLSRKDRAAEADPAPANAFQDYEDDEDLPF